MWVFTWTAFGMKFKAMKNLTILSISLFGWLLFANPALSAVVQCGVDERTAFLGEISDASTCSTGTGNAQKSDIDSYFSGLFELSTCEGLSSTEQLLGIAKRIGGPEAILGGGANEDAGVKNSLESIGTVAFIFDLLEDPAVTLCDEGWWMPLDLQAKFEITKTDVYSKNKENSLNMPEWDSTLDVIKPYLHWANKYRTVVTDVESEYTLKNRLLPFRFPLSIQDNFKGHHQLRYSNSWLVEVIPKFCKETKYIIMEAYPHPSVGNRVNDTLGYLPSKFYVINADRYVDVHHQHGKQKLI